MARILALDYGSRRTGIATTDPSQIIATILTTVETTTLLDFLIQYIKTESVEKIVIGQVSRADGSPSALEPAILELITALGKEFPNMVFDRHDESYTSQRAQQIIFQSYKQKKRQDKSLVDKVSALLILQEYLGFI
jgi:putative Holliday junction resolvase